SRHVDVPWSNKNLEITWEHFTSKLEPNQKETWTAVIKARGDREMGKWAPSKEPESPTPQHPKTPEHTVAEMVATLYDRSLDAFAPLYWQQRFDCFRQDYTTASAVF